MDSPFAEYLWPPESVGVVSNRSIIRATVVICILACIGDIAAIVIALAS